MNAPSWRDRLVPQRSATTGGQHVGGDDAGGHGVLEVVADVGDAVGPRHDLALRRGRRRPAPRVVADAVERLGAQVERAQRDVGAPRGVVVAAVDVRRQGVLAGVAARPVAAVVAEGDGLGQGDVEPEHAGDGRGDLGDLEGVGEAGALVVVGEHEHLGLAGQAAERRRRGGCGRGRARSRCATSSGSSGRPRSPAPTARVADGDSALVLALLAGGAVAPAAASTPAHESAWARRTDRRRGVPAIVAAQRSARSCIAGSLTPSRLRQHRPGRRRIIRF